MAYDETNYHKIVGKPSLKLGDLLLEHSNLKRHSAALIEGNAVLRFTPYLGRQAMINP